MCRTISFLLAALLSALVFASGQETQPTASLKSGNSTVLVLPVAPPLGQEWVGRAIQQDMLVDLTQTTRARVLAPAGPPANDAADALRAGREVRADYVVYAQAQNSGSQLRVTGQVLNVANGLALSPIKATAPTDELFPLEDALAAQVARALPQSLAANVPNPQTQPSATATVPQPYTSAPPSGPLYESVPTPAPEYYSSGPTYAEPYPYSYDYPYYYPGYWGWGWWGPGVIIVPHHWHDHDFDHDFDDRPFLSSHVHPGFQGGFGRPGPAHSGFGGGHAASGGHAAGGGHER